MNPGSSRVVMAALWVAFFGALLFPPSLSLAEDSAPPWEESGQSGGSSGFALLDWGPNVGLSMDPDQLVLGAHMDFAGVREALLWSPVFEFGIGDDFTTLNFELDCLYLFGPVDFPADLHAGAGLALYRWDWDAPRGIGGDTSGTELGIELIGGLRTEGPGTMIYRFDLKLGVGDIPDLKLMMSINL